MIRGAAVPAFSRLPGCLGGFGSDFLPAYRQVPGHRLRKLPHPWPGRTRQPRRRSSDCAKMVSSSTVAVNQQDCPRPQAAPSAQTGPRRDHVLDLDRHVAGSACSPARNAVRRSCSRKDTGQGRNRPRCRARAIGRRRGEKRRTWCRSRPGVASRSTAYRSTSCVRLRYRAVSLCGAGTLRGQSIRMRTQQAPLGTPCAKRSAKRYVGEA